ncbi:hypothetical protein [Streptomyces sp. NPDC000880]
MTQPITAVEANELLSPHLGAIGDCIDKGWKSWRELLEEDPKRGIIISNRSRANLVHDFIRYEATQTFDADSRVIVSDDRGFLLLTFAGKILLRFKKFSGPGLRTSSIPTQQSREYANQVLPGMDELTHLVAGYLPDEAGLGLDRIAITCTLNADQLWVLDLDLKLESGAAPVASLPITSALDQRDTIIRPKSADEAEETPDETPVIRPKSANEAEETPDETASGER